MSLLVCGVVLWRQKALEIVYLDQQPIIVEVANTEQARTKGLSGREAMVKGHGMLFSFDGPSANCMWMKDMHFALDVYWYSATGNLINSVKDVSPSSYPRLYCPEIPASYMLEVNAGEFGNSPQKLLLPVNQ